MTKEEAYETNVGLIYSIMNDNFYGAEREDLFQQGVIGLLNAYDNYKNDGTAEFSSYAYLYIFGEMCKFAKQKQIKVSKSYLELYKAIETVRYSLAQKKGYIPTNEEIALFLEKDVKDIEQAILAGSIMVSSLDKGEADERSIYETIAQEEAISLEDRLTINEGLEQLTEEERKIIEYRYFEDMTQSEVARVLKKNQAKISRSEKKSIDKIREYYAS